MSKAIFQASTPYGLGREKTIGYYLIDIPVVDLNLDYKFFDDPDPFVSSTRERSDVTYSSGLNILFQMEKFLEDIQWPDHQTFSSGLLGTIGINYKRTESNLENFEYENTTFQISIIKQIAF